MRGRAKAAKTAYELSVSQAWHGEAFARQKHLEKLSKYLGSSEPQRAQTPEEMLAILRSFQSQGAGMTFEKIH